jgi:hypothetical protein
MGLVSLINDDLVTTSGSGRTITITDNKYFYTDTGANLYEVYRGVTKVCDLTVTAIQEHTLTVTIANLTLPSILAADEVWISGTYTGPRIFRWPNTPVTSGQNIKQYDTFKLSGSDNDPITLQTNIGNVLMVANNNSMSSWNDYTLENFDLGIGCSSKNGYVKLLGSLYFMHYTGIYATSGSTPKLISNKIERYINGATKLGKENSAAGKKGRSIFFTLGNVTLYYPDGSVEKVLNDVCVEYSITQENWFVHTNVKASQFATFIETTDSDRLEFTDTGGAMAVKEFLSGETDDGTEIFFRADLPKITLNQLWELVNNPIGINLETERGSSMKCFVSMNEGNPEYYELQGKINKGVTILKIHGKGDERGSPPPTRLISLSIRDSSKQLCRLLRLAIVFVPTNQSAIIQ